MRGFTVRSAAAAASVALHLLLLWRFGDHMIAPRRAPEQKVTVTRLNLTKHTPPEPAPPMAQRKPEPPKPKPKPAPRPKPEPEPVPEMKSEPAPAPEPVPATTPTSAPEPPKPAPPPAAVAVQKPPAGTGRMEDEKRDYMARVLGLLENNKYYPAAARRRGLEGVVKISFTLLAEGDVRDIKTGEGHGILKNAAEEAVKKSLPLPAPPDAIVCPLEMECAMKFSLD